MQETGAARHFTGVQVRGETRESTQGLQLDRYLIVQLGVCEAVGLEDVFA